VSKPISHSVIGVDYLGEQDWYVNVQLSHQHIFDHEKDILFLREDNFYLSGEINKEFWRGNTMLKLRYAVDLHDGGSFFTPEGILNAFIKGYVRIAFHREIIHVFHGLNPWQLSQEWQEKQNA